MKKKGLFLVITVISILTISCKKEISIEDGHNLHIPSKELNDMLVFTSDEDLNNMLNTICSIESLEELHQFEQARGYSSIGYMSDEYYESINLNTYKSLSDFENDMANHSQYIDMVSEPDSSISYMPIFYHDRCRYVANVNGMYQVGNYVTKLFSTGKVTTGIENVNQLANLTDNNLSSIENDTNYFIERYPNTYVKASNEDYQTEGDENVSIETGCETSWIPNMNILYYNTNNDMRLYVKFESSSGLNMFTIGLRAYCKIKHNFFGKDIWFKTPRNISFEGKSNLLYKKYIGGSGPSAYSSNWTDTVVVVGNGVNHWFYTLSGLYTFPYYPVRYYPFGPLSPKWDEIVRLKKIQVVIHSASVNVLLLLPLNNPPFDNYTYYLIGKYF